MTTTTGGTTTGGTTTGGTSRRARRRHAGRRALAALALVGLAAFGAGCGTDDETTGPATDPTAPAGGTGAPSQADADFDPESLVGMPKAEAERTARAAGWQFRVAREDGEEFALTMDYREDRVNVEVDDGVVTDVNVG
jgi:hypothetical protein